jgi:hypothetical protein
MAIFIPGMLCPVSGRRIDSAADAVMFGPFVNNEADPLYIFSDAVVHVEAFKNHPLGQKARARFIEASDAASPANRACYVCGRLISDPDNYVGLGHLVEDVTMSLHKFNYAHFHRSCFSEWPHADDLVQQLQTLDLSERWRGAGLKRLIATLRDAIA